MNPELNALLGPASRTPDLTEMRRDSPLRKRLLAWVQGIFYVLTGVWPLISIGTFQAVTGPKIDLWLVKTAGVLIIAIGATLLMGAWRRRIGPELMFLGAASAASLAGIDLVYALSGRISDIYLLDAGVEILLVLLWGAAGWKPGQPAQRGRRRTPLLH